MYFVNDIQVSLLTRRTRPVIAVNHLSNLVEIMSHLLIRRIQLLTAVNLSSLVQIMAYLVTRRIRLVTANPSSLVQTMAYLVTRRLQPVTTVTLSSLVQIMVFQHPMHHLFFLQFLKVLAHRVHLCFRWINNQSSQVPFLIFFLCCLLHTYEDLDIDVVCVYIYSKACLFGVFEEWSKAYSFIANLAVSFRFAKSSSQKLWCSYFTFSTFSILFIIWPVH